MKNPDMLAVNQNYSGYAGDRVWTEAVGKEVWAKPLPGGRVGVVVFNRNGTFGVVERGQPRDT